MNEIEMVVAREKIKAQLYLYCKSVDEANWPAVRSCFADEHVHQHGSFEGSADEFVHYASITVSKVKASQHCISNLVVNFSEDGLSAESDAYFNAVHQIEAAFVPKMHFYKDSFAERHPENDCKDTDWLVAGIYKDRWVFRDGGWLIVKRNARHIWERIEPSSR